MFKLVVVGGKFRGKEYNLEEGENIIGRSGDCSLPLLVDGVSKKHLKVTVNNQSVFAEDLGSSNGTLVNGKVIKRVTLKSGDQIALPSIIFQLVNVVEKKVIVKRTSMSLSSEDKSQEYDIEESDERVPENILGKIIWAFKHKFMPIIYSFNEQYEWSALMGILLFIFIAINISLTIVPVLSDSRRLLLREVAFRAKQYAAEVDRLNNVFLRDKNLDQVYTGFLEGDDSEGVQSYRLFDPDGRVYRPVSELSTIVNDSFSVDAQRYFKVEKNWDTEKIQREGNIIKVARAIKAHDKNLGRDVVVAIIALTFAPTSLATEASNNSKAYLESLITSGMVAIIFFGILYYLTIRPIEELKIQIERVLRGRQKEIESKHLFKEIYPLRVTLNSVLSRIKELQNTDNTQDQTLEEDGPYIRVLEEFLSGAHGATIILNSEKILMRMNPEAEDLIGFRENSSTGQSILDLTRDQGLAATIIGLCDESANNGGSHQKENYEIGGKSMSINVTGFIGKDRFAKGFYITFVRSD
jgi:pSer/pThr/pTyr-binding forkhead associated (FHA) protein